jgi:hypothetical protein
VAQDGLEIAATNTPVMVLLLTPFSLISWTLAKWMFLVVNVGLMLATGWLAIRHLPFAGVTLASLDELLLFIIYFDLSATRIAIENGQTTLTVFLFMLLAIIYAKRSWQIAAIALGIALSKYSVALPVFLFFLYKRNFKISLGAVVIQALGVLALAGIAGTSPVTVAMENVRLFFDILNQPGVYLNLSSILQILTPNQVLGQLAVVLMTAIVFVLFFLWARRRKVKTPVADDEIMDFHVLALLFVWTLLAGYHRIYDAVILIVFVILVFKGIASPTIWRLSSLEKTLLMIYTAAVPAVLIVPERLVDKVFPSYYGRLSTSVTSIFFIMMLIISMLLLRRYALVRRTEVAAQEPIALQTPIDRKATPGL